MKRIKILSQDRKENKIRHLVIELSDNTGGSAGNNNCRKMFYKERGWNLQFNYNIFIWEHIDDKKTLLTRVLSPPTFVTIHNWTFKRNINPIQHQDNGCNIKGLFFLISWKQIIMSYGTGWLSGLIHWTHPWLICPVNILIG